MVAAQFRSLAVEEQHEQEMNDLRMGNGSANDYFQELERLAKLAGRRTEEEDRGIMVRVVRRGVPYSYIKMIGDMGDNVPDTYPRWKVRISKMYEERQKQYIIQKMLTHDNRPDDRPSPKTGSPHSNPSKPAGATSTTPAKTMGGGGGPNRDASTGKWVPVKSTTYAGQGQPMEIDWLRKEGRCYRCKEKGHLSRDCPKRKEFKDIHSVAIEQEKETESKVDEVKE